jgi:hypothetical protein
MGSALQVSKSSLRQVQVALGQPWLSVILISFQNLLVGRNLNQQARISTTGIEQARKWVSQGLSLIHMQK